MPSDTITLLRAQGLLPLFFHSDPEVCINIVGALYNSGIRIVEFTNRGEAALANFSNLRKIRDQQWPGLLLAAGTIKTRQHALTFLAEGADFLISPGLNEEVAEVANQHNKLWVPGCMTPSEIMKAERFGATLIKLFPGNLLGPAFVNAIKELFPLLSFIPTGGVSLERENLAAWFASGVIAVGAGSTLITKQALQSFDYKGIEVNTREALELVQSSR